MRRVFVYGTLKRGFRNHRFLEAAAYVGEAYTVKAYRMLDGRFPVLRDAGPHPQPVAGEVYDVDDGTLAKLDELEDVASRMYDRREIDVVLLKRPNDEASTAFIYIGCGEYWDKKDQVPYLATDERGLLNWLAPNMRAK